MRDADAAVVPAWLIPRGARHTLIVATVALWLASGLTIVTGLIRGKVSAVVLGTDGMGMIAQLNYFATFVVTLCVLGVTNGSIKLLAEAKAAGDAELDRRVRSFVFVVPVAIGIVAAGVTAATAAMFSDLLLGSRDHAAAVAIAAASVPLAVAAGGFSIALQGHLRFTALARINATNAVAGTILVVALVLAFGLNGAIAGVALTSLSALVIYLVADREHLAGLSLRRSVLFDRRVIRAVYAFGAASVVLSVLTIATELVTRTMIVHRLGISGNGLYQPVVMLSSQFFLAMVAALSAYLFPRLTTLYADGKDIEASRELNLGLKLILAPIVPSVVLVIALAPAVLTLAFSREFVDAEGPLAIQMFGDVLRALGWTFGAVLLPLGLIRAWLAIGVATLAVQLGLTVGLVGVWGLNGVAVAYSCAWAVNATLAVVVARRQRGVSLERSTMTHVLLALGVCLAALVLAAVGGTLVRASSLLLLVGWWAVTVRGPVWASLTSAVRSRS